jgi:molybdopterin molybdotransferase
VTLQVVDEIAAGHMSEITVGQNQAAAIMTGAPLPSGADAIVPVEDTEQLLEDRDAVRILRSTANGRYIARKGSDAMAEQRLLRRGMKLEAAQIGVAASVGVAKVEVYLPARVGVLSTGDEIVPIDQTPGPAQIRNSNSAMLVALLRRLGAEVHDLGSVRDEPSLIRNAVLSGLGGFDVLFITGGMSMGEYDYVPRVLADLGLDLKITKLRIKPGKPFVFGVLDPEKSAELLNAPRARYVFGLPGNPVSGFVCTMRLASRLLARLAGGTPQDRWLMGRLETGLPANGPREFYQPALLTTYPGDKSAQAQFATISALTWKGSADIYTLATANALLVRAENEAPMPKGTLIRVLEI